MYRAAQDKLNGSSVESGPGYFGSTTVWCGWYLIVWCGWYLIVWCGWYLIFPCGLPL